MSVRPLLKWPGGKRWLVPKLKELYDPSWRLVDPFVGGASVPIGLNPKRCLVNDISPHVINLYWWLREGLDTEGDWFQPVPFKNDAETYYANRDRFNALIRDGKEVTKEAALLFYYLNRTGFNGLCRFNSKGEYNVPFGKYAQINYLQDFDEYREYMDWDLQHGDFSELELEPTDFIYADPPYDAGFTKYTQGDFTWEDQERLAKWLAAHPGPVVASNRATERIVALYKSLGFDLTEVMGPRRIAANGNRDKVPEMLATRNL